MLADTGDLPMPSDRASAMAVILGVLVLWSERMRHIAVSLAADRPGTIRELFETCELVGE